MPTTKNLTICKCFTLTVVYSPDKTLSDLEAMYLEPIEVKPPPNVLGLRDKGFQRFQQSPPPPPTFPFATKGPGMTRNLSSGRIPPLGDGIPAPSSLEGVSEALGLRDVGGSVAARDLNTP